MKNALISWSGGKDSCYALQKSINAGIKPVALITVLNENATCSKSNGVSKQILGLQAEKLGLPIITVATGWDSYEGKLLKTLVSAKLKFLADYCIFGDIDIEEHRMFEEKISNKANMQAILPLWGYKRYNLAYEIINTGIKAKISVIRKKIMSDQYLGLDYSDKIFSDLKNNNIDLLGENGEFHTVVYDSPLFESKIKIKHDSFYDILDCKSVLFKVI